MPRKNAWQKLKEDLEEMAMDDTGSGVRVNIFKLLATELYYESVEGLESALPKIERMWMDENKGYRLEKHKPSRNGSPSFDFFVFYTAPSVIAAVDTDDDELLSASATRRSRYLPSARVTARLTDAKRHRSLSAERARSTSRERALRLEREIAANQAKLAAVSKGIRTEDVVLSDDALLRALPTGLEDIRSEMQYLLGGNTAIDSFNKKLLEHTDKVLLPDGSFRVRYDGKDEVLRYKEKLTTTELSAHHSKYLKLAGYAKDIEDFIKQRLHYKEMEQKRIDDEALKAKEQADAEAKEIERRLQELLLEKQEEMLLAKMESEQAALAEKFAEERKKVLAGLSGTI